MSIEFLEPKSVDLFVGLDLGQVNDFTALAVLHKQPDGALHLKTLDRTRGEKYPEMVRAVARYLGRPELARAVVAADQTGCGRPVVDALREAMPGRRILGVTVTSGNAVTSPEPWSANVPKKTLVSTAQLCLQDGRLKIASTLKHAELLTQELTNFKVKITASANEVFGEWREGEHDDLVFAVAAAAWLADIFPQPYLGPLLCSGPRGESAEVKKPENWREALEDLNYDLEADDDRPAWPWS
jgi:hypothetical protein